jgi:hypothetical protein
MFPFSRSSQLRQVVQGERHHAKRGRRGRQSLHVPPRVLQLEDRLAPAAVSWNGGAGTLNWGDAMNWSSGSVPGSTSDVVISASVSGTINLGAQAFHVRTLNDSSASLAIATGGSLSLAAVVANSNFGQNVTIAAGATLTIGAGANVLISPNVTITDNGTLTFGSGDNVNFGNAYADATNIVVGANGLMTATATSFFNSGNYFNSQVYVAGGGHLQATNSSFSISQVYLDNGSNLSAGDLVGNAFDTTLLVPASEVQNLSGTGSNNLRFQDIDILGGTLSNNQTLALNAIGTATTANLRYVFPPNFIIAPGSSVAVAPNVNVLLPANATLTDNGSLSFGTGDTVNFVNAYATATDIVVGGTGAMIATTTSFYNSGSYYNSQVYVAGGGHLQASNCGFSISSLSLDNASVLNPGDLVGNAFDLPLTLPAGEVQYLSGAGGNNLRFQDINILGGTLGNNQSLALNAIGTATTANLRYVFPANFIIASGSSVTVASNVNVLLQPNVTLTDNGDLSFGSGDNINFANAYATATNLVVGGTGTMNAYTTSFFNSGSYYNSQVFVSGGGHLQASGCGFTINSVYLDNASVLNPGDLVGSAFDLPLTLPAGEVQDLSGAGSNNLRFQDINILGGTLGNNQTLALNAIGTATTANLRYVFPANFTIASGATVTVAPNVNVLLQPNVTLTDNGTLTFGSGDTINFGNAYTTATMLKVGGTGSLTATTSSFFNSGSYLNSQLYVAGGGHLRASNSAFTINSLYLDSGSVLNPGDLVGNAFDLPLTLPAGEVQDLSGAGSNNLRFQDINILGGTLGNSQTLALNAIGTATTANLRFVFSGNFTIASGAGVTVASNVNIVLATNVTLTDKGTLTFGSGDGVNFANAYTTATNLVVNSGGILNANGVTFFNSGNYFNSLLDIGGNGSFQAYNSTINLSGLTLDVNSNTTLNMDIVWGTFTINSSATINITPNDFSNLGASALVAVGNSSATIHLENNYWGTTISAQIAAKLKDHRTDNTRPLVSYTPYLNSLPVNTPPALAPISNQNVTEGTLITFTAVGSDSDGDTLTYSLDPGAPAGAAINPTTGVFTYTPDDGPATYTITVRVTDSGPPPLSAVQSFNVAVSNVPPTVSLTGPLDGFQGVPGQTREFILGAADPSQADSLAGFRFDVNWGDGTPNTLIQAPSGTHVTHVYSSAGSYAVKATATDKDGARSTPVTTTEAIGITELQNGVLVIGGTPGNDIFDLAPGANTGDIAVTLNGTALGTFSSNGQCQIIGNGGSGDVLNFDDVTNTASDLYVVTASTVTRTNAATINFSNLGTVNVEAGTGANTIDVQGTPAGTTVNVTMGNGGDTINLGSSGNTLDGLQGALNVTGGTGSNTLNLYDQGSSAAQTYAVAATTINRSGAAGITYHKMATLALTGSSGIATITIVNTAAGTPVVVNGSSSTTTLQGPNGSTTWTLSGANSGTVGNVTFNAVPNLTGGSSSDTFTILPGGSITGTINGGTSGGDSLDYSSYGTAVTVNLQAKTATGVGHFANIKSLTGSPASDTLIGANAINTWQITGLDAGTVGNISFTAFDSLVGGTLSDTFKLVNGGSISGTISGGGGSDWLDYTAYAGPISVNLSINGYNGLPAGSATAVGGGALHSIINILNARAGSGGSTLVGGGGNILVGGSGNDTLVDTYAGTAASGASLLIGGGGSDTLTGGSAGDILIGQSTSYDTINAKLQDILNYWKNHGHAAAFAALQSANGLPSGHERLVWGTTVTDDASADVLNGTTSATAIDWFFAGAGDTIANGKPGMDYLNNGLE